MPDIRPADQNQIRQYIADGNLNAALQVIDDVQADAALLALKSRWRTLQNKVQQGVMTSEEENVETNKINTALVQWLTAPHDTAVPESPSHSIDTQTLVLIKTKLRQSLNFYYLLAIAPITVGIGLIIFFLSDGPSLDLVESFGSVFVSSISGFPIKEIFSRKDRISLLEIISMKSGNLSDKDIDKIKELYFGKNSTVQL